MTAPWERYPWRSVRYCRRSIAGRTLLVQCVSYILAIFARTSHDDWKTTEG
jgi:hypothetical protein